MAARAKCDCMAGIGASTATTQCVLSQQRAVEVNKREHPAYGAARASRARTVAVPPRSCDGSIFGKLCAGVTAAEADDTSPMRSTEHA